MTIAASFDAGALRTIHAYYGTQEPFKLYNFFLCYMLLYFDPYGRRSWQVYNPSAAAVSLCRKLHRQLSIEHQVATLLCIYYHNSKRVRGWVHSPCVRGCAICLLNYKRNVIVMFVFLQQGPEIGFYIMLVILHWNNVFYQKRND